jgi:hypothetical protein
MKTKNTYLSLLDIIDGIVDNATNRTIAELIVLKKYLLIRIKKNLHIQSKYVRLSSVVISPCLSFDTYKITDYRCISKIDGIVCNIGTPDNEYI